MNYHFIWKLLVTLQIDDFHVRGAKNVFMPTNASLHGGTPPWPCKALEVFSSQLCNVRFLLIFHIHMVGPNTFSFSL